MKLTLVVGTDNVGSDVEEVIEVSEEELAGLDQTAKERLFQKYLEEWVWEHIDAWYEVVEDE